MQIGDKIPSLSYHATSGAHGNAADFQGKWLVVYFYPKDATPGCTLEGNDFRAHYQAFRALNAEILGVSRDTLSAHEKFKCKQQFPFELVSDSDELWCNAFDVLQEKSFFGKKIRGIVRSTFLINPEGELIHEWRRVRVLGHVKEVLDVLGRY